MVLTGGQITFPAVQVPSANVNTLDDYEEGSWTPSVGGTATYTFQNGFYIKIGRMVYITCSMQITLIGTGSANTVSGLPFPGDSGGTVMDQGLHDGSNGLVLSVDYLLPYVAGSTSTVIMAGRTAAAIASSTLNVIGGSTVIIFSGCYMTTN